MKIAVDYQSVKGQRTGIGTFTANLIETMKQRFSNIEFFLYTSHKEDLNTTERIAWESLTIPLKALRGKPDLLYSPGFAPAIFSPISQVVTVHDLIGSIYPKNQKWISRFYWGKWQPFALKKADKLVASSESTRLDLERLLGIPRDKIDVVYIAAHPSFKKIDDKLRIQEVLIRYGITAPFLISVSTLEPRKNHLKLLQAYESLRLWENPGFWLLIIGKPGGAEQELYQFVKEKKLERFVKFLGYVNHEDLICFYNAAVGYVMISLYEGFGLPALEAMSCGIAGIVSNASSLPEVTGKTALLVDPDNVGQIADALREFSMNSGLRNALAETAYARSKEFSVSKTSERMFDIFCKAINS